MSRYFPHSGYAEDQHLAKTILTTHIVTRSITTGTIIGMGVVGIRQIIKPTTNKALWDKFLIGSSRGILAVSSLAALGLVARMWGRDKIEWQDRSWRLMENEGQLETDDWTYAGMAAAACFAIFRGKTGPARLGWQGINGALGIGSLGGLIGYLGWRYAINGGNFPKKQATLT